MSHPGRRRAADRRARRAERKQDRKKKAQKAARGRAGDAERAEQIALLRSGAITRDEFELRRTDIPRRSKIVASSKRAEEDAAVAKGSTRTQAKRGKPVTQDEIALRRTEQAAATRLDRGDIGKTTALERKQQKLRDDRARLSELRKEGFDERKEAKRRGVSVNVIRAEERQLDKEIRQADAQARNIAAGTSIGRGAKKITFESARTRQDIRRGTATPAQIRKQEQSFEAAVNERVGRLSAKQATQQTIVRILEEESMKRALVIASKDQQRFASETTQLIRDAAAQGRVEPGLQTRTGERPGIGSTLRDAAASNQTQLGATSQLDSQAEFDARVDRAVAAIVQKPGADVRSEVARDMKKIADRMELIVDPAAISRFAGAVALNAAADAPIDFSRELSFETPPVTVRFTDLVDRDVKALVADPKGRDIRTEAANIIRTRAEAMGLEVDPRDISAFGAAAAEAAAQNLIPDSSIEGVSAPNRQRIVRGIVSGELNASDLKDLDPTSRQRLIVIAGRPLSGATFTQMNRELSAAQKSKGQATFLDRVLTASLVDEGVEGGTGQDIKLLERAKHVLGLSNVKSENKKAAAALLNDVTQTVKATAGNDEYLIFLARTGQLDDLEKDLVKQPVTDRTLQEIDSELRRQSAEEALQAVKIGALGAVGVARAPLPKAFTGLPGKAKDALKKANLPASGRALVTKVKSTTAGSTRAFKDQVARLSKEFGESAVLGSGPVPFKLPKLRVKQLKVGPKKTQKSLPAPRNIAEPLGGGRGGPKVLEPVRRTGSGPGGVKPQPKPAGRPAGTRPFRKGAPDRTAAERAIEDFLAPPKPKVTPRPAVKPKTTTRTGTQRLRAKRAAEEQVAQIKATAARARARKAAAQARASGRTPAKQGPSPKESVRGGPKTGQAVQSKTQLQSDTSTSSTPQTSPAAQTVAQAAAQARAKAKVRAQVSSKLKALTRTSVKTETATQTKTQVQTRSKPKTSTRTRTRPATATAVETTPAEQTDAKADPKLQPKTDPGIPTETETPTAPTDPALTPKKPGPASPPQVPVEVPVTPPVRGRAKDVKPRKFSLPSGDRLPRGVFPEIVEFPLGEVVVTVDIVKGERSFRANTGDLSISPRDGFKVVSTTTRRPTNRTFAQGITSFVVTEKGVSFARRRFKRTKDKTFSSSRSRL